MTSDAVALTIRQLPPDARVDVEERAAIMEYDGGLSREQAEREALAAYQRARHGQQTLFAEEGKTL